MEAVLLLAPPALHTSFVLFWAAPPQSTAAFTDDALMHRAYFAEVATAALKLSCDNLWALYVEPQKGIGHGCKFRTAA